MKASKTRTRNLATANPDLIVKYVDSGYSREEWRAIYEAMRKYEPDPKAANVFPRLGSDEQLVLAVGGSVRKPSVRELLNSRHIQEQLWAVVR